MLFLLSVAHAVDPRDAVVLVEQGSASCAGTLIDDQGTVLTAYHCVMSGGRPRVTSRDGRIAIGRVRGVDRRRDLAVVQTGLSGPHLEIRETPLVVDEPVRVIGHPNGAQPPGGFFTGLLRWAVSDGQVSAVGPWALQVSAPINPGNSGGPVVDDDNRVIGVVSRRMVGDGLGFAGRVDVLPSPRPMSPLGGSVEVGVHLQTMGAPLSVGATTSVVLRDRVVLTGALAVPLGLRWESFGVGRATHMPFEGRVALRQRLFRGPVALRLDGYAGVASVHELVYDERFERTVSVQPLVGGRVALRGVALDVGAALADEPAFRTRVEIAWPGTLFKL